MKVKKIKRKPLELIAVIMVVLMVVFLVGANVYYQRQEAKQKTLFYQLQIMRSAVNLFIVVRERIPANLIELAEATYKFPGDRTTKKFLGNPPLDEKGEVIDPFGNKYFYDPRTGWVRSATRGYEFW